MSRIQIYDTTLRDGAQGEGVNFSLQDKLLIARRLDECGFDFVEGGYPLSNPKDAEFFRRIVEQPLKRARLCAFGMTRRRGVKAADDPGMKALIESQAPVVTIVGKTSDFHVTEVLRVSLEENLAMIRDTVAYLREMDRDVIYDAEHFFDGWKANPEYARKTIQAAVEGGAMIVVMCDTNGGSMPEEVAALTKEAAAAVDVPLGIHTHNDCDLAVANSLTAVAAGAVHVQGTINGLGERCGNADLISIMANLALKKQGYEVLGGSGSEHLTELSRYVYEIANMHLRINQPFVGTSAFAHKGGMHVHAVNRVAQSYEHITPESVGNTRRVLVSELSGRSNIVALTSKANLQQDSALMENVLKQVVEMENRGYQFEAAEASFDLLVQRAAGTFKPHFELLHYRVDVETDGDGQTTTEATVKLHIGEDVRHEVAEGDGPVNALDAALRKALNGRFPNLRGVQLVDYKVRVINSDAGTAAAVRVVIESQDEDGKTWGTVGVNENVIKASWDALVDSIEYKLCKDAGRGCRGRGRGIRIPSLLSCCAMSDRQKIRNYRDLAVWQLGMDITVKVYEATKSFPSDERFGLTSQLRRAVASVPANIAEGHARSSTKDYLRFVAIAIGSLAETATFIELAGRLNYGNVDELRKIFEMTLEERRMLRALQKSLRRRLPPP